MCLVPRGALHLLNSHLVAFIPVGRAINPITKTNWEGVGVRPDVPVRENQALDTAYVMALEKQLGRTTDLKMRQELDAATADAKKRLQQ
jgi:retinol-binding protein 3